MFELSGKYKNTIPYVQKTTDGTRWVVSRIMPTMAVELLNTAWPTGEVEMDNGYYVAFGKWKMPMDAFVSDDDPGLDNESTEDDASMPVESPEKLSKRHIGRKSSN